MTNFWAGVVDVGVIIIYSLFVFCISRYKPQSATVFVTLSVFAKLIVLNQPPLPQRSNDLLTTQLKSKIICRNADE